MEGGKEKAGKGHLRKEGGGQASRTLLLSTVQGPEVVVCSMKKVWALMWPQQMELVKL